MKRVLVIYSGGMDSYTLLHHVMLNNPKAEVKVLSFNYNQRHKKELEYAKMVCDKLPVLHIVFDMPGMGAFLNGSSLTSDIAVPEGHYAADNMKLTVVPGRNTIMLSIAMGIAEAWARQTDDKVDVYYGAHSGDHTIYPDCRPEYFASMKETVYFATEDRVELHAPYMELNKTDILSIGKRLHLDYSETWSCYAGLDVPCGKCGACTERAEAFAANGMEEPTPKPLAVAKPVPKPVVFLTEQPAPKEQVSAEEKPKKRAKLTKVVKESA
jgi:7-cyano-7-deazaguanine synthase